MVLQIHASSALSNTWTFTALVFWVLNSFLFRVISLVLLWFIYLSVIITVLLMRGRQNKVQLSTFCCGNIEEEEEEEEQQQQQQQQQQQDT